MRKARLAVLCVQIALTFGFVFALRTERMPLGVRGEWEWLRLPHGVAPTAAQWAIGLTAVVGYAVYAALGYRSLSASPGRGREAAAVSSLVAVAVAAQILIALAAPEGYGLAKWVLALHNPGSSGYYTVAKKEMNDPWRFLAAYPDWIKSQDALHIGTHPPGLFLVQHILLRTMDASPESARFVVDHLPHSVSSAFVVIEPFDHLGRADRATLAITGALTLLFCSATVLPLYLLARASHSAGAAWAAATFWPLVPAAILFQPAADTAFPMLATTALALAVYSGRASRTFGFSLAAGSGAVLAIGMSFSLVFLPIGSIVAAMILADSRASRRRKLEAFMATGLGFLAPTCLGWSATNSNPFLTWWWNQRNHARFYEEYPRSFLAWVAANPLELAVAIGIPTSVWILVGLARIREAPRVSLATLVLLAGLTLSGRNLSEVARLWLPMMPTLLVAAGAGLSRGNGAEVPLGVSLILLGSETLFLQATIQCVYPT